MLICPSKNLFVPVGKECIFNFAPARYNILWWEKECWFIDVSQAVEPIHPSGLDFLFRFHFS